MNEQRGLIGKPQTNPKLSKRTSREKFLEIQRLSIYIYDAQLKKIDEICKKRGKTRRIVFFEAFQSYIALYREGKV